MHCQRKDFHLLTMLCRLSKDWMLHIRLVALQMQMQIPQPGKSKLPSCKALSCGAWLTRMQVWWMQCCLSRRCISCLNRCCTLGCLLCWGGSIA